MATKKSYEVRFGINDTEVSKQLANIDKSLKGTQGELKLLKTNLSENWDTSKWVRAQEIASKAVEDSAKKSSSSRNGFPKWNPKGSRTKTRKRLSLSEEKLLPPKMRRRKQKNSCKV